MRSFRRISSKSRRESVNHAAVPELPRPYRVFSPTERPLSGAAPKNFVEMPGRGPAQLAYIAKRPTREHAGARECVTEHLIARIGSLAPLRLTPTRLARFPYRRDAAPSVHLMSRFFLVPGRDALLHGVEAAAMAFDVEKTTLHADVHATRREQEFYTLEMIREVLSHVSAPGAHEVAVLAAFARMVAFDALLGVKDRHAQNWGLIEDIGTGARRFAPLFDTARGLFVWMDDAKLRRECVENRRPFVQRYAQRSRPLIGTGDTDRCNHFDLFAHLLRTYPRSATHDARRVVLSLAPDRVRRLLRREFGLLLSPLRLELVCELLEYRRRVLLSISEGVDWRRRWPVLV